MDRKALSHPPEARQSLEDLVLSILIPHQNIWALIRYSPRCYRVARVHEKSALLTAKQNAIVSSNTRWKPLTMYVLSKLWVRLPCLPSPMTLWSMHALTCMSGPGSHASGLKQGACGCLSTTPWGHWIPRAAYNDAWALWSPAGGCCLYRWA